MDRRSVPVHRSVRLVSWTARVIVLAVVAFGHETAGGFQRTIRTRIANYEEAPVKVQQASTQLVQTYSQPGQFPLATLGDEEVKLRRSRVRYLNHLNHQVATYLLEGELVLENVTRQEIIAVQLTTVFLNAFRERIGTEQQSLTVSLAPRRTQTIRWSRNLSQEEVFELYVVVTRVRFHDGTVWTATEELILVP